MSTSGQSTNRSLFAVVDAPGYSGTHATVYSVHASKRIAQRRCGTSGSFCVVAPAFTVNAGDRISRASLRGAYVAAYRARS